MMKTTRKSTTVAGGSLVVTGLLTLAMMGSPALAQQEDGPYPSVVVPAGAPITAAAPATPAPVVSVAGIQVSTPPTTISEVLLVSPTLEVKGASVEATSPVAFTGSDTTPAIAGIALTAAGAALIIAARRRQSRA